MSHKPVFSTALLALVLYAPSCTQEGRKEIGNSADQMGQSITKEADRTGDKMSDAVDDAAAKLARERQELSAQIQESLDKIQAEISEMDTKMQTATAAEKAKWKVRRAKLEHNADGLKKDLNEMAQDTKREWGEFKENIADAIAEIEKDLKNQ